MAKKQNALSRMNDIRAEAMNKLLATKASISGRLEVREFYKAQDGLGLIEWLLGPEALEEMVVLLDDDFDALSEFIESLFESISKKS